MKTVEQWFDEYGESHRNPLNKLVHWICVPLITFSVLGMLWALHPLVAAVVLGLALAFYVVLSWQLALVMALQGLVMLWILHLMPVVFWPCVAIFVVAWIGQFIGHHVEGKKPSFFKDVQFLLIGPAWLMGFVFRASAGATERGGRRRAQQGSSRHSPGCRSPSSQSPIRTLTSRRVGNPTAAVMRLTWRLRPSRMVIASQLVGMLLRKRTGGWRGHRAGSAICSTSAGRVGPSLSSGPARSCASCSAVGSPSTCTQ